MTLRDFLEAELENRQSSGGSETDYVNEAEGALAEFDALRAELDQAAGVIVDRNREIADLIADLDTAKSNTGEACARIATLEAQLADARAALKKAREGISASYEQAAHEYQGHDVLAGRSETIVRHARDAIRAALAQANKPEEV